ncbi:MAG: HD domain-containing protein [Coriobacteriia bacterium]
MGRQYIAALAEGERVDAVFALKGKQIRATRTGDPYLLLEFSDRTGRIGGIMFRPRGSAVETPVGAVVAVRGTATAYRGILRITAEEIRPVRQYDATDLLPSGTRDPEELVGELRALVKGVGDPALSGVVRRVFSEAGFMKRFRMCPASQSYHHAYIGGLLEHTVGVATLCRALCDLYPHLDGDLLLAGALLHDIGKVDELVYTTGIDYTDDGRMIGHVVLGERRVRAAVDALGDAVPHETATRLAHVLLAHHGELEWGSPKRPCTLEALMLHHADNLDAKTAGFIEAAASAARVDEAWTDAGNLFRRPLWAPRAAEDDRWMMPSEDGQYALTA